MILRSLHDAETSCAFTLDAVPGTAACAASYDNYYYHKIHYYEDFNQLITSGRLRWGAGTTGKA